MFPHIRFLQLTLSGHARAIASLERLHAASQAGMPSMQDSDDLLLYLQGSVELLTPESGLGLSARETESVVANSPVTSHSPPNCIQQQCADLMRQLQHVAALTITEGRTQRASSGSTQTLSQHHARFDIHRKLVCCASCAHRKIAHHSPDYVMTYTAATAAQGTPVCC
jgi:hypothetical protein